MQLESFLELSAERFPQKTAVVCGSRSMLYRDLDLCANRLAHGLIASGVARGDRVVIFLDNSIEACVAIWAIAKAGAVFVVLNPTTKVDKLAFILNHSRASALITSSAKIRQISGVWHRAEHLLCVIAVGADDCDGRLENKPLENKRLYSYDALLRRHEKMVTGPEKRAIDIDLAALVYTSGSTGSPKGVMLTHLNMVSAARSITTYLKNRSDDVIMSVLPLSFDYGLYQLLMSIQVGGTLILEPSFTYAHASLNKFARHGVTGFPIVPTMLALLLRMDLGAYDFSSLRYVSNTGAALPPEHIRQLRRLWPHAQLFSMYGLTECKRVSYLEPSQVDKRPTSVGKAIPNEEVFIIDEKGNQVGPNVVGELVVRGSHVMKGYWEDPEATRARLKPGPLPNELQLHTGDLFLRDDEGYLYFVGRKDDIIKSRGEKVAPREIENILHGLAGVSEAAVVGIADPILGQRIKAVIVLQKDAQLTTRDVLKHCATYLEAFMLPQTVEFVQDLPRGATGKVDKQALTRQTQCA